MSSCPVRVNYAATPYQRRPGITAALRCETICALPFDGETVPYTQRDINEMLDRGWVRRDHRREWDKAWVYRVTKRSL